PGSSILSGMYNGHFGSGYEYPALLVSWKNTGTDIAVLVRNGDHRKLEVLLYNSGQEKTVTMKTWQLEPGKYRIRKGFDQNDDDRIDDLLSEEIIDLQNRVNEIEIRIPSRALIIFSVEQIKSY